MKWDFGQVKFTGIRDMNIKNGSIYSGTAWGVKSAIRDEKAILKESPEGPKRVLLSYNTKAFSLRYIKHSRLPSCTPGLTGIPRN